MSELPQYEKTIEELADEALAEYERGKTEELHWEDIPVKENDDE